jgi:Protein of unknown function (DUF2442)
VDADNRHHRRNRHSDVAERSPAAALSRSFRGANGQVRHSDREYVKRRTGSPDDQEGAGMDNQEPVIAFTGMDPLPPEDDDDEIVTVGEPIPNVVSVSAVAPLTLAVKFDNGVEGRVRFEESALYGVFALLKDPKYFGKVGIQYGAVSWPNETPDMCPDTMHDEIVRHGGEWVLQ